MVLAPQRTGVAASAGSSGRMGVAASGALPRAPRPFLSSGGAMVPRPLSSKVLPAWFLASAAITVMVVAEATTTTSSCAERDEAFSQALMLRGIIDLLELVTRPRFARVSEAGGDGPGRSVRTRHGLQGVVAMYTLLTKGQSPNRALPIGAVVSGSLPFKYADINISMQGKTILVSTKNNDGVATIELRLANEGVVGLYADMHELLDCHGSHAAVAWVTMTGAVIAITDVSI